METITVSQKRPGERGQASDAAPEAAEQGDEQEKQRKRARLSCNTCKARKTKCVGVETGACQYCRTLGIPCEADPRSRKRPFYRVSGEVYEYTLKLLRRFVSEEELPELTVENIEALLQKLDSGEGSTTTLTEPSAAAPSNDASSELVHAGDLVGNDVMEADEHPLLQEELGCMLLDSKGKYRYVGADSNIRWNHAARMAAVRGMPAHADPIIIPPLKSGLLPPTSPEDMADSRRERKYLPPKQLGMEYVARFFDQIHCIYWFYSTEQFYPRLDETYESEGRTASPSWLCSLYSIFAMGSMRPANAPPTRNGLADSKTPLEYCSLARDLLAAAADEAGVDSIKAFALLSLAMHATCYSVTAYLLIGTAMRIAFSLGLHRDVSLRNRDSLERERSRRLWWTIFILDYEMAGRFDYPSAVMEQTVYLRVPPATEQILDPGPNTPLGYQSLLVSLIELRKRVSRECFLEPAQLGGRLPISRVTGCLSALREWHAGVPVHLRADSSLHPQHRRAVALLHLRFWVATIALTRPFLLFAVAKMDAGRTSRAKRKVYEQMSGICIEAAESAVRILRRMREDGTLSSLMLLDCHHAGEVLWILILALQRHGGPAERREMLRFCLETVKSMEKVGWAEKVAPELEARVIESGVLEMQLGNEDGPLQPAPQQHNHHRPHHQQQQEQQYRFWLDHGLQHHSGADGQISITANTQVSPTTSSDYIGLNLDTSHFDVFETLDLDQEPSMLDMFMDASFSGSQFLYSDLDGTY